MKKTLSFVLAASLCVALFAADIFTFAPLQGNVESYTKTEFTIASKFGDYFRTPSVKFNNIFDEKGHEIESSTFTPNNVKLNTITSTYDSLGNLKSKISTSPNGEVLYKVENTYKNGLIADSSEFNSKDELKGKTIYTYSFDRLIDESSYDGEGALIWKIIYTYDGDDRLDSICHYMPTGILSAKATYKYLENGKIESITHFDSLTKKTNQEVFRYNDNGSLNEITTYEEDKQISKRILFKYDAKGNVTKVTTYNVSQKFGTILPEIAAIVDYEYKYADSDSVPVIPE